MYGYVSAHMEARLGLHRGVRDVERTSMFLGTPCSQDDSGWRAISSTRVDEIYQEILKGQWGNTTMGPPSLLVCLVS